jgi:hypothetical protein
MTDVLVFFPVLSPKDRHSRSCKSGRFILSSSHVQDQTQYDPQGSEEGP